MVEVEEITVEKIYSLDVLKFRLKKKNMLEVENIREIEYREEL